MRTTRAFIGYDATKVRQYASVLETELLILRERRLEQRQSFEMAESELLHEIQALTAEAAEAKRMEEGLKQWIQRNRP